MMTIALKYFLKIRSFPKYTLKGVEYIDDYHLLKLLDSLFGEFNKKDGFVRNEEYDTETDTQWWTFSDDSILKIEHPYQHHDTGAVVSH
jgi:hypothetical protein